MLVVIVGLFILIGLGLAGFAVFSYRRILRRAKNIERGLKMVPFLIHLPPPSDDTNAGGRDVREVVREKISQTQVLYDLIAGTATQGFRSRFYGQRHLAFELVSSHGLIYYCAAVPVALASTIQQAIVTAYPGARVEQVDDPNIFNQPGKITGVTGGELTLKHEAFYPIATYGQLERDPMEAIINAFSSLQADEGAAIQILLRPANTGWAKRAISFIKKKHKGAGGPTSLSFTPMDVAKAALNSPQAKSDTPQPPPQLTDLEQSVVGAMEEKTKHAAYEVLIRVVVSSASSERSQVILHDVVTGFALFDSPGLNGFKYVPARDIEGLVTAFIFRFFPPELNHDVLNSVELATLFHLPDAQFTPTAGVQRQTSKQVDGPATLPTQGLLVGYNVFREVRKEIRLSPEDRRRHTYIVGQTGTGKSTMLENLAVQDMLAGNGFAFIDPHGDTAERLISMVPKNRSEDIIYFNPADTAFPLGLNLFEFSSPEQKDFLIQEAIGMLYKLYDPGHTGIIGPRYEHWFRNAALTLMSDPAGATFIEIPKVFTDMAFLKQKFPYLQDPTVVDFWTKEMAQTSDYHKSEMLGWFVSKFGAFQSNQIMRNIIGQPKSAFNLRDVMDQKKILIVNLSKGQIGELNSQLLGMIFVIKFQAAAMGRAATAEAERPDFCLYVDEFQNFSTDSFASILSEARKYHLNLIVANQFIGQLSDQIRDAVFGNVGTIISFRSGPEDAEFLVKQFAPVFDAHDLVNLPNFNAVARLMIGGLPSQPFSLSTLPPLGLANPELGLAIKQLSAAKFGQNRDSVEQTIFGRLQSTPAPAASTSQAIPAPILESAPAVAPAATPVQPMAQPAAVATALPPPPAAPTPVGQTPVASATVPKPVTADTLSISDITRHLPTPTPTPAAVTVPEPVSPAPMPKAEDPMPPAQPKPSLTSTLAAEPPSATSGSDAMSTLAPTPSPASIPATSSTLTPSAQSAKPGPSLPAVRSVTKPAPAASHPSNQSKAATDQRPKRQRHRNRHNKHPQPMIVSQQPLASSVTQPNKPAVISVSTPKPTSPAGTAPKSSDSTVAPTVALPAITPSQTPVTSKPESATSSEPASIVDEIKAAGLDQVIQLQEQPARPEVAPTTAPIPSPTAATPTPVSVSPNPPVMTPVAVNPVPTPNPVTPTPVAVTPATPTQAAPIPAPLPTTTPSQSAPPPAVGVAKSTTPAVNPGEIYVDADGNVHQPD